MNVTQARRLYRQTEDGLNRLDTALFGAEEADALGLDRNSELARVNQLMVKATDALVGLASLDASASALRTEIDHAVAAAKAAPFDVYSLPPDTPDDGETEVYRHPIDLRGLLGRIGDIYGLEPDQLEAGLSAAQGHMLTICRNAPAAILAMISKKMITVPTGEHQVKHLLFAFARASYADAVPDGAIAFEGKLQKHKPDFGIPRLKCCVETKIARDRSGLSAAIGGIIDDQSTYGSEKYSMFIGVIYTNDDALTQELLDEEIADRIAKGGQPNYEWYWVLIHGPLVPPKSQSL